MLHTIAKLYSDKANSINHAVYCLFLTFSGYFLLVLSLLCHFRESILPSVLKMHVNLIVSVALEVYTSLFTNVASCTLRLFCQLFLGLNYEDRASCFL